MKKRLLAFLLLALAGAAWAGGLESLEAFVRNAKSGRATFSQTVTPPPRQGEPARAKTSSGSFEFQRPGKFRFDYSKPFVQTIVADGQSLWIYDADLNQATQRSQAQALGSTPAALIAAAPDLRALQADFTIEAAPDREGLQWVKATPKDKEGQLQSVQVGFRGGVLAALEILDNFGQRSQIIFGPFELNTPVRAGIFSFKPPPGVDLIRQ